MNYLGKGAAKSLFTEGNEPAFFFAITLHTLELASPAVGELVEADHPLFGGAGNRADDDEFTSRHSTAAPRKPRATSCRTRRLNGKTVVMVWEHKHIANEKLEAKFEGQGVTLRQLLKLDILPGVPKTWPGDTYDYFWIVDFPENSNVPSKFTMVKQEFGTSFPKVPANDWDTPDGLDASSGCKIKAED